MKKTKENDNKRTTISTRQNRRFEEGLSPEKGGGGDTTTTVE
jgi:hypothetical protein